MHVESYHMHHLRPAAGEQITDLFFYEAEIDGSCTGSSLFITFNSHYQTNWLKIDASLITLYSGGLIQIQLPVMTSVHQTMQQRLKCLHMYTHQSFNILEFEQQCTEKVLMQALCILFVGNFQQSIQWQTDEQCRRWLEMKRSTRQKTYGLGFIKYTARSGLRRILVLHQPRAVSFASFKRMPLPVYLLNMKLPNSGQWQKP